MSGKRYPCSFLKACYCKWCVYVMGWSLTQAAIAVGLNVGTVSHVIHGHRFPASYPIPLVDYSPS
jgi:hypothetical protein